LTQSWSDKIAYNMTLDKPESFWAACHRPVSYLSLVIVSITDKLRTLSSTLLRWRVMMLQMWRTVWRKEIVMKSTRTIVVRSFGFCLYKRAIQPW
jgi:hypothetical protein